MKQSWRDYEYAAEAGPLSLIIKVTVGCFLAGLLVIFLANVSGIFSDAGNVVRSEIGPQALLTKYEWFKNASAELDKKQADITVYQSRMKQMDETYEGASRRDWAREDREQYNVWSSEVAGVKASYNQLAAEYNAQMAKVNWRFVNVGSLPDGVTQPLPRAYKPYVME